MQTFKTKVKAARRLIRQAVNKHKGNLAVACSFGKDSMVLTHLCLSVNPKIKVFSIMTPFKFKETYEYREQMVSKYNMNISEFGHGPLSMPEMFKRKLPIGLWQTDSEKCCMIYKVETFKRAIKELKLTGFIAGIRKDEGKTRTNCKEIENSQGLEKTNAILDFTEVDIWKYMAINNISPHPLYAEGYRSLGCECCSGIVDDSEGERDGRWQDSKRCGGECQIHTAKLK